MSPGTTSRASDNPQRTAHVTTRRALPARSFRASAATARCARYSWNTPTAALTTTMTTIAIVSTTSPRNAGDDRRHKQQSDHEVGELVRRAGGQKSRRLLGLSISLGPTAASLLSRLRGGKPGIGRACIELAQDQSRPPGDARYFVVTDSATGRSWWNVMLLTVPPPRDVATSRYHAAWSPWQRGARQSPAPHPGAWACHGAVAPGSRISCQQTDDRVGRPGSCAP